MPVEVERPVLFPDLPRYQVRRRVIEYPSGIVARRDIDMYRLARHAGTLDLFTPAQQRLLDERFARKKSYREIAQIEGVSPSTASRRARNAMRALKQRQDNPLRLG